MLDRRHFYLILSHCFFFPGITFRITFLFTFSELCVQIQRLSPWPKVACRRQCRQSSPVRTFLAIAKLWLISPYPTEYIPLPTRKDEDNSPHVSHRGMGSLRRSRYQGSGGTGGYWQGNHRWESLSPSVCHLMLSWSVFTIFACLCFGFHLKH